MTESIIRAPVCAPTPLLTIQFSANAPKKVVVVGLTCRDNDTDMGDWDEIPGCWFSPRHWSPLGNEWAVRRSLYISLSLIVFWKAKWKAKTYPYTSVCIHAFTQMLLIHWFTPQMMAKAGNGPSWNWQPGCSFGFTKHIAEPQVLEPFHFASQDLLAKG